MDVITEPWPGSEFPCHRRHRAEDVLLDPWAVGRTRGVSCPTCEKSYRATPREYGAPDGAVTMIEWTYTPSSGDLVVMAPYVESLKDCDAPLYPDPPWPARLPENPRRELIGGRRKLELYVLEDVWLAGYAEAFAQLVLDAGIGPVNGLTSLIISINPVTVQGIEVVARDEVLVAERGWLQSGIDRAVLAHSRSVDHMVVVSRDFAFLSQAIDDPISPWATSGGADGGRL